MKLISKNIKLISIKIKLIRKNIKLILMSPITYFSYINFFYLYKQI